MKCSIPDSINQTVIVCVTRAVGLGGYVAHFYAEKKVAVTNRAMKSAATARATFLSCPQPQLNSGRQFAPSRVRHRNNLAKDGHEIVPMKMFTAPTPFGAPMECTSELFHLYNSKGGHVSSSEGTASKGGQMEIVVSQQSECQEEQDQHDITDEWRLVAIVIDRFLFWIFLIVSTISTTYILLYRPLAKPSPT